MGTKTQDLWAEGAAQNKLSSHPEQQKPPTQILPFNRSSYTTVMQWTLQ